MTSCNRANDSCAFVCNNVETKDEKSAISYQIKVQKRKPPKTKKTKKKSGVSSFMSSSMCNFKPVICISSLEMIPSSFNFRRQVTVNKQALIWALPFLSRAIFQLPIILIMPSSKYKSCRLFFHRFFWSRLEIRVSSLWRWGIGFFFHVLAFDQMLFSYSSTILYELVFKREVNLLKIFTVYHCFCLHSKADVLFNKWDGRVSGRSS